MLTFGSSLRFFFPSIGFDSFFFLGEDFKVIQKEVANILKGRILVGHALRNDLKVSSHMPPVLELDGTCRLFSDAAVPFPHQGCLIYFILHASLGCA